MFNALFTVTPTVGLPQILEDSETVYTKVLEWVGDTIDVIVAEPILMITFCLMIGGTAIGIFSRLARR